MPLTPFHGGPALLVRAAARRRFSFAVFTATQIAIDLESGANLALGRWPVHAHLHTVLGSLVVAAVVALAMRRPLSALNRALARRVPPRLAAELGDITWPAAAIAAAFGALSHIALDAMMHADMQPFAPFTAGNPLLLDDSFTWIHRACALAGLAGALLWLVLTRRGPGSSSPVARPAATKNATRCGSLGRRAG